MKKEITKQFSDEFSNGELKVVIDNLVWQTLGVTVDFVAASCEGNVILADKLGDAEEQLTATPLLRQMFRKAEIYATVDYAEETNDYLLRVRIGYEHSYNGGRNGLDLMRLAIRWGDNHCWKIYTK